MLNPDRPPLEVFPFIAERADPQVFAYRGEWYFLSTDDRDGKNEQSRHLVIRRASSVAELAQAAEIELLSTGVAHITGCFWAPEAHEIGGQLRILFSPSVDGDGWTAVQSHLMTLRGDGDPTLAADWSDPVRIERPNGQALQTSGIGITLDMTYLQVDHADYLIWSQRQVSPVVTDAELWISGVDPQRPERLVGTPARLLAPKLDWERRGAAVVEGPFAIRHGDTIYLSYAASAVGPEYATGVLSAPAHADLLDPSSWTRRPVPALDAQTVPGQFGPGHVSFFSLGSEIWMAYHALATDGPGPRHTGIRRIGYTGSGDLDLRPTSRKEIR